MVAMNQIEEFGRRIGREFGAKKMILFGSYTMGDMFMQEILTQGRVLYEATDRPMAG